MYIWKLKPHSCNHISSVNFKLYYISEDTQEEYINLGDVEYGGRFFIDTYAGHEFAVKLARESADLEIRFVKVS